MNAARASTLPRKAATSPTMMLTITITIMLAAAKALAPVSVRQMVSKKKAE
ncbi:hypothetical protein [Streptomyces sp. NPDC055287]